RPWRAVLALRRPGGRAALRRQIAPRRGPTTTLARHHRHPHSALPLLLAAAAPTAALDGHAVGSDDHVHRVRRGHAARRRLRARPLRISLLRLLRLRRSW